MRCVWLLLVACSLVCGCSRPTHFQDKYATAYQRNELGTADDMLTKKVEHSIRNGKVESSKDSVWLLLDRATVRFVDGRVKEAIADYNLAIEALNYYSKDTLVEQFASVLLEDTVGAYIGEDYEHVLARLYFAFALDYGGDTENSYALLRQAEEWQQRRRERYSKEELTKHLHLIDNPMCKLLFGIRLDRDGDHSNAIILLKQAQELAVVNEPKLFDPTDKDATILIVGHNGNLPRKVSGTCRAATASTVALDHIISAASHSRPALSTISPVPIPEWRPWWNGEPVQLEASVNGRWQPLIPVQNVSETADLQVDQKIPLIAAKGVARIALRRAAVEAARSNGEGTGELIDFIMFAWNNSAMADTRGWITLPASLDVARFDLPAGRHTVELLDARHELNLEPGDLCIIHLFYLHPGSTRVLIPERFRITGGVSS